MGVIFMNRFIFIVFYILTLVACEQEIENPLLLNNDYTREQINVIDVLARTRKGNQKECYDKFLNEYLNEVYKFCEATDFAKDVSGGCGHLIHYTKNNPTAKWTMLKKCGIKTKI